MWGRLVNELRRRFPALGRRCDYENSRASAIKLFCLECNGGDYQLAATCKTFACPLWQYAFDRTSLPVDVEESLRSAGIPTLAWYEERRAQIRARTRGSLPSPETQVGQGSHHTPRGPMHGNGPDTGSTDGRR